MLQIFRVDSAVIPFMAVILIFLAMQKSKSLSRTVYMLLVMCVSGADLFAVASEVVFEYHPDVPHALLIALRSLYFLFLGVSVFLYADYVYVVVEEKYKIKRRGSLFIIVHVFMALYLVNLVVNLITGDLFSYENGRYRNGPALILVNMHIWLMILLVVFLVIRHRKVIPLKQKISIATFTILMLENPIYELIVGKNGFRINFFAPALALLVILLTMETPDYPKLVKVLEQLRDTKEDAEKSKQLADEANKAKTLFLARMSHEIRTPINTIGGMSEMMLRESKEEKTLEYAENVRNASISLQRIVDDILDVSKIENGEMEIKPVRYKLRTLIEDLHLSADGRAKEKKLDLVFEVDEKLPSELYGDDGRIRQILNNLLSNAIKYTKEGSVTVRIGGEIQGEDALLSVSVEDTGMGIRKEDIPKLFENFQRIDEEKNRNIEGTGLGIVITTYLLRLMGSQLRVESEYGKGSAFSFDLKQRIENAAPIGRIVKGKDKENSTYKPSFYAPKARILVVDDNTLNRVVFRSLLKQTGIKVDEANGGKACLEKIENTAYDLIFMDHMMPEMDGIETFHHIREGESPCKNVPVIVITANAILGAKEEYLKEGFDAYLSKPVVPIQLEETILAMLPKKLIERNIDEKKPNWNYKEAFIDVSQMPRIDGIDWDYAKVHFGSLAHLLRALKDFCLLVPEQQKLLQELEVLGEQHIVFEQFEQQFKRMEDQYRRIGFITLMGMTMRLRQAVKEKNYEEIKLLNPVLIREMNFYRDAIINKSA